MKKRIASVLGISLAISLSASAAVIVDYTPSGGTTVNMPVADQQASGADTWTFRDAGDARGALAVDGNGSGGTNMTIYGGIISTWAPASDYNPLFRELNGTSLQLRLQVTGMTTSRVEGVYLWNNADYLVGAGLGAVLGAGSTVYWNLPNYSASADKDLRVVVNQGGTYYISDYSTSVSLGNTAAIDGTWQWAVLNTNDYTWGSYADLTLNDVQGVGLYFVAEMSGAALNYATVAMDDFVVAAISEPVAAIELSTVFADGCVLQRDRTVPVWGTASPNETITVQVKSQSAQTQADTNGNWRVELSPEPAGGPFTLTVSGSINDPVVLSNVYFGDVWLLTGQSNMFQTLLNQDDFYPLYYPTLFPNAGDDFDDVRFAIVQTVESTNVVMENAAMSQPWNRWEASALSSMSAAGYFFVRALNDALDANGMTNIPLGVIKVCVGGTAIEQWMSAEAIAGMGEAVIDPIAPSGYYNGMIAPIQGYAIKGVLWYQGEGNSRTLERVEQYPLLQQTLIESWRAQWGIDFPFYFVQLAPYMQFVSVPADEDPNRSFVNWAWMRESQAECLAISNTAMACIIDRGFQDYIHPPYKDLVGQRLARIAEADCYGLDVVSRGPTVAEVAISNATVLITYDNVADGLQTKAVDAQIDSEEIVGGFLSVSVSSNTLAGFALCGTNQVFYWATEAGIVGTNQVLISNAVDVPEPVAVRYAWQSYPRCNLYNSEGLPAEPFRTDNYEYGVSGGAALTRPPVELFLQGTNLTMEWPPLPADWALESTTNLLSTNWVEVGGSRSNTAVQVPIRTSVQAEFFRLKR